MNQIPRSHESTSPQRAVPPAPARRRRGRTAFIAVAVIVLLLGVVWWVNHRQSDQAAGPGGPGAAGGGRRGGGRGGFGGPNAPLPVGIRRAEQGDINIYLTALGTITPSHVATIRTQISGQLLQIAFQEGQLVHQGDLLALIDPRPYENTLSQAEAQLKQAQSQLRVAQADLQRYETLAKEDSIAKQQVDTTRSQVNQYEGLVQAAQASIATANLNITYCHIKAPFDGRVGLRLVDTGNYITPGDANGIVVLTQVKPITVIFTLPEDNMAEVLGALHGGKKLPVDAFDRTQTKKIATGTLITADNQIDPATGTFKLRAEFANEDESLFPNQFVNIRLLLDTVHDAVVIPTSAVERGQQGPFIYVVQHGEAGDTAAAKPIKLGQTEGERVAVTDGLAVGDEIVVDGADRLKDGQRVILNGGQGGPGMQAAPGGGGGGRGGPPGGGKKWDGKRKKGGGGPEPTKD